MDLWPLASAVLRWIATGPRVRVETFWTHIGWPPDEPDVQVAFGAIVVRNFGRLAAQIIATGLESESGQTIGDLGAASFPRGLELPITLEPHHHVDWTIIGGKASTSGDDIIRALREAGYDGTVRLWGSVTLGTGKKVLSDAPIEIDLGVGGGGALRAPRVRPETW